jgi:D-alanyl-D-alanine carboxypeptidase
MAAVGLLVASCSSDTKSTSTARSTTTSAAPQAALLAIDTADLNTTVETMAKDLMVPGVVVVLRTPKGDYTKTYGTSRLGATEPVTLDQHVRVGSNTKTMVGTVILQLIQEGKLGLDDPVSKYRPDVPNGNNITIAQMLNMRSGLFNYSETLKLNQTLDTEPLKVWTEDELLALAYENPPYFPPGTGYHYSNTNTVLLGLIAEKLDAKPLARVLQDRLFTPLGMKNTVFPDNTSNVLPDPRSHGYVYGTNVETMGSPPAIPPDQQAAAKAGTLKPRDATDDNPSWGWAAGQVISTANDLVTWVQALAGGNLLNPDLQAKRLASCEPTDPANPGGALYGFGIGKFGNLYGHSGELPGFNSFMGNDPVNHVTLVVWANLAPSPDGESPATAIARTLIGKVYATAAAKASTGEDEHHP